MKKKNRFIHNHTNASRIYFFQPSSFAENNLFYIQCFGYEECTKGYFLERDNLDSFLLLYTIEGNGILKYESKTYKLAPNTCFLINCNKFQNYFNNSSSLWKYYFIHFNGLSSPIIYQKIIGFSGPVFQGDESLLSLMKKPELNIKKSNGFLEIYNSEIISSIIAAIFRCTSNEPKSKTILIEKVVSYLENNFEKPISVDDVAKAFYVNSFYLQHLFKKTTSYSIHEYLLKLRLVESERLLVLSDYSIAEISEKIGFNSASTFIRFFKNKTEMSPLTFRKTHTKKIV